MHYYSMYASGVVIAGIGNSYAYSIFVSVLSMPYNVAPVYIELLAPT